MSTYPENNTKNATTRAKRRVAPKALLPIIQGINIDERTLGRIESKIDDVTMRFNDVSGRLRRIEKQMHQWQGSLMVVLPALTIVGIILQAMLRKVFGF
jgi:hypothetical protein